MMKKDSPDNLHGQDNSVLRLDQLLAVAVRHHQAGRLEEAEQIYRQILQVVPDQPDAMHLLGIMANQTGKPELAEQLILKSIKKNPTAFHYYSSLGLTQKSLGKLDAAVDNLREALRLKPDFIKAIFNLGLVYQEKGDLDAAIEQFQEAIRLKPDFAEAYNSLATAFHDQGDLETPIELCREAIRLKPDFAEAIHNLGTTFYYQGNLEEALEQYDQALQLNPDYAEAHLDRGRVLLSMGRSNEGWREHEWRFKTRNPVHQLRLPQARWDGSSPEDRIILVYAEQGVGDEIIHASCYPDLIRSAKHCVFQCDPRLADLFARSFPTATVRGTPRHDLSWLDDLSPIDAWIAAGSLPLYLRPDLESYPDHRGYLVPESSLLEKYRSRLDRLGPGLKVGICWRGKEKSATSSGAFTTWERLEHFTRLEQWKPILATPGIHFINLQYGDCREELDTINEDLGISIHEWDDLDLFEDLESVAALTAALDLVITAPTAVFDMAGALGVETWMLYLDPDWIMLGTGSLPWFPAVRVFYRGRTGNWDDLLGTIAKELQLHPGSII